MYFEFFRCLETVCKDLSASHDNRLWCLLVWLIVALAHEIILLDKSREMLFKHFNLIRVYDHHECSSIILNNQTLMQVYGENDVQFCGVPNIVQKVNYTNIRLPYV